MPCFYIFGVIAPESVDELIGIRNKQQYICLYQLNHGFFKNGEKLFLKINQDQQDVIRRNIFPHV
jgi:hypothetical protein